MKQFLEKMLDVPEGRRLAAYRSAIAAARSVSELARNPPATNEKDPIFLALADGVKRKRAGTAPGGRKRRAHRTAAEWLEVLAEHVAERGGALADVKAAWRVDLQPCGDPIYVSPAGARMRSKAEVVRSLGLADAADAARGGGTDDAGDGDSAVSGSASSPARDASDDGAAAPAPAAADDGGGDGEEEEDDDDDVEIASAPARSPRSAASGGDGGDGVGALLETLVGEDAPAPPLLAPPPALAPPLPALPQVI